MSKVVFTSAINPEKVVIGELNQRFTDLKDYVNTAGIGKDAVEPIAIAGRNLRHTLTPALSGFAKGAAIGTLTGVFGWHYMSGTVLAHSTTMTAGVNRSQLNQPIVEVTGFYAAMYQAYSDVVVVGKAIGIGYSTTGAGGPYTVVPETIRPLGYRNVTPPRAGVVLWLPAGEPHYYDGAAGWFPRRAYNGKNAITTCQFGGVVDYRKPVNVDAITHYALMLQGDNLVNDIHVNDRAYLFLTARENSF